MAAGDFLKNAWNTTTEGANSAMEAVGDAVCTAAETVADVANTVVSAAFVTTKVAVIVPQLLLLGAAKLAFNLLAKVAGMFSPTPTSSAVASCPLSPQQRLARTIGLEQKLIASAKSKGLGSNPAVAAAEKHVAASQRALMSDGAYRDPQSSPVQVPGYHQATPEDLAKLGVHDSEFTPNSGMRATLYVSNPTVPPTPQNYTLAFAGTDPTRVNDLLADAGQALGLKSDYYSDAETLASELNSSMPEGSQLDFTGHSLGGGEAQAAVSQTGRDGTVFNAAGLNPNSVDNFDSQSLSSKIDNYTVDGEPLTTVQQSVLGLPAASGNQIPLPAPPGDPGFLELHGMASVEGGLSDTGQANISALKALGASP